MSARPSECIDLAGLKLLALVNAHRDRLGEPAASDMLGELFRVFDAADDVREMEGRFVPRSHRERRAGRGARRMWRGLGSAFQRACAG